MAKDIWEDMLGPEATTIMRQAVDRHRLLVRPEEEEAVRIYETDPHQLNEIHKAALADLLTAIADDFSSRRRAEMLREAVYRDGDGYLDEDEDEWIPDEDGGTIERKSSLKPENQPPPDDDLEGLLDSLDDDD